MTLRDGKQRIRYVDFFKALLMILVVLGHINFANESIKAWIYAFHMPAFFFASGMLIKDNCVPDLRSGAGLCFKKFQALMFPYFIWALIYSALELSNIARILYGSHQTLAGAGSLTSLWFLPVLFISMVFFYIIELIFKDKLKLVVKLIIAAVSFAVSAFLPSFKHGYPWGVNLAFAAFGFMLLGNVAFPLLKKISAALASSAKNIIFCVLAMTASFAGSLIYLFNIPEIGYVNMSNSVYGNYLLFLPTALFGTIFVLCLSMLLDRLLPSKSNPISRFLSFLGQNTLCVFVVQKPIIRVFGILFDKIHVPDAVALIVTCIFTTALCCVAALFFNRFMPVLVGKLPKKEIKSVPEKSGRV